MYSGLFKIKVIDLRKLASQVHSVQMTKIEAVLHYEIISICCPRDQLANRAVQNYSII